MRSLFLLVTAILTGCIGFGPAVTAEAVTEKHDEFIEPAPAAGEGVVYFYGTNQFAVGTMIWEDEIGVAVVHPDAVTYLYATPGTHTYTALLNGESTATIDVEAGESYFVRYSVETGFWGPRPNLEYVPFETGSAAIPTLRFVTLEELENPIKKPTGDPRDHRGWAHGPEN